MEQVLIFQKDNPILARISTEQIEQYSQLPDTDMNPITPEVLMAQDFGFCAVNAVLQEDKIFDLVEVIGYAGHTKDREYAGKLYTQIGNLAVLPDWQGLGLAKALLGKNKDYAIAKGLGDLSIVCNALSSGIAHASGFEYLADVVSDSGGIKALYVYHHGTESSNRLK